MKALQRYHPLKQRRWRPVISIAMIEGYLGRQINAGQASAKYWFSGGIEHPEPRRLSGEAASGDDDTRE